MKDIPERFKKDMLTYNEVKRLLAEKYNSEMAKEKIPEEEKYKNASYRDDLKLNETESLGNPSGTTG
ncbi:MAG: hypothetical protein WBK54_06735 [Bacilli bacterium]|jgi:hypothetical protein|nr:hypothetical protein [Acholeplasmataceae bacterium]